MTESQTCVSNVSITLPGPLPRWSFKEESVLIHKFKGQTRCTASKPSASTRSDKSRHQGETAHRWSVWKAADHHQIIVHAPHVSSQRPPRCLHLLVGQLWKTSSVNSKYLAELREDWSSLCPEDAECRWCTTVLISQVDPFFFQRSNTVYFYSLYGTKNTPPLER